MPKRKHHSPTPQESTSKKACIDGDGSPEGRTSRRRVRFRGVEAYYFPRAQGFCCVPSSGGTALGMAEQHEEHDAEVRRKRERLLREMSIVGEEEEEEEEDEVSEDGDETESCDGDETPTTTTHTTHTNGNGHTNGTLESHELPHSTEIPHHHHQTGEEPLEDDQYFLQPLMAKQRVALLRESGVESLSIRTEKEACHEIRLSRQVCGCNCEGSCEPETCACAISGIRCQVDRASFPCACTKEACANPAGRIEFDPIRVRSHYLNTMLRLKLAESGRSMTPTRHMRFGVEEGNVIPTNWDHSQGPDFANTSFANSSLDSGIDSPSEPVALSQLYAHHRNGFDHPLAHQ